MHRATFSIEPKNFEFLEGVAANNRSAYINQLIADRRQAMLEISIIEANAEESASGYLDELDDWDVTLSDGLNE